MNRFLPFLAAATFAASATAQQPAAASAVPPPPAATMAHGCSTPGEHPGRLASDIQRRNWTRSANSYLECMKKFIAEQQAAYNAIVDKAKPHMDAANAAIDQYNKSVAAFKAAQEN